MIGKLDKIIYSLAYLSIIIIFLYIAYISYLIIYNKYLPEINEITAASVLVVSAYISLEKEKIFKLCAVLLLVALLLTIYAQKLVDLIHQNNTVETEEYTEKDYVEIDSPVGKAYKQTAYSVSGI